MMEVTLRDGWKIGEVTHATARLRELTALDAIQAAREAERIVPTPNGYVILSSPGDVAVKTLLRQIEAVGDYEGEILEAMLAGLSAGDLDLLLSESEKLDAAVARSMEARGRDEPPDGGD